MTRKPEPGTSCWLARFTSTPCAGRLVRVHLVTRQLLRREGHDKLIPDPRTWVWGCGGPMGNGGHHGMLDQARTLRVPRSAIPDELEALMADLGLSWWLEREYGPPLALPAVRDASQDRDGRTPEDPSAAERSATMAPCSPCRSDC